MIKFNYSDGRNEKISNLWRLFSCNYIRVLDKVNVLIYNIPGYVDMYQYMYREAILLLLIEAYNTLPNYCQNLDEAMHQITKLELDWLPAW